MPEVANPLPETIEPRLLSLGDWVHLVFGFFWRGIVYAIASMLAGAVVGGVVGGVLGAVMGVAGSSVEEIKPIATVLGGLLGFAVGLVGLRFYIQWLLNARYGRHRLVLVRMDAA